MVHSLGIGGRKSTDAVVLSNAVVGLFTAVVIVLAAGIGYHAVSGNGSQTSTVPITETLVVTSGTTATLTSTVSAVTTIATVSTATVSQTVTTTTGASNAIVPLRVFAVCAFTPAFQAIQSSYQQNNSVSLIYNFASAGALEMQIAQGVPTDIFISADVANNIKLQNQSLLANGNTYQTLAYNYVELFVSLNNPKNITSLSDLLKPGVRIAIGAPASVPAGKYTLQVWQNVQSKWGNSSSPDFKSLVYANYSAKMMPHIVSQTTDINMAINQVLTGAADAVFGYVSDGIANAAQVNAIPIPPDVNIQVVFTISVIKSTTRLTQANAFVNWLLSPEGQALLKKWGFTPVSS